jgi:hypothetical protein
MEQPEEQHAPGMMMPAIWVVLAVLGSVAACVGVGLSASDSETMGVYATKIAAFPLGFLLSAALSGLIIHFAIKRATTLLRVVAPMGCGCLGGLVTLAGAFFFFMAIFPAL